ncbi:hypothetical protein LINPERPRIM_LOCUS9587 [Linum perenne]
MGDDRVSWSGRTMECFNVNNGKAYLSPVRANEDNTCFYRALCDSLDARARIVDITDENAQMIRDKVVYAPIVGSFRVYQKYLDPDLVYRINQDLLKDVDFTNSSYKRKKVVFDDPTPPYEGLRRSIPPQRQGSRVRRHVVCIVGFGNEEREECYEVQEIQGENYWDEGFRFVARRSIVCAFIVDLRVK